MTTTLFPNKISRLQSSSSSLRVRHAVLRIVGGTIENIPDTEESGLLITITIKLNDHSCLCDGYYDCVTNCDLHDSPGMGMTITV